MRTLPRTFSRSATLAIPSILAAAFLFCPLAGGGESGESGEEDLGADLPVGGFNVFGVSTGPGRAFGRPPANPGQRLRRAMQGGGNKPTEKQIDGALAWLAVHQEDGGYWSVQRADGKVEADVQGTAQALLAFCGAGHTEKVGLYKDNVRRAVAWLVQHQEEDGKLGGADLPTHAWAALALTEAAAMGRNPATMKTANGALEWTAKRLEKVEALKMEPLMLVMLQLKTAKVTGLPVEGASFEKILKLLENLEANAKVQSGKRPVLYRACIGDGGPDPAATAKACLIKAMLGERLEDWSGAAAWFLKQKGPPAWPKGDERADLLYWFAASQVLFQAGGEPWKTWNDAMKPTLIDHAQKEGDAKGSWDPQASQDLALSRTRATALCALCLEVYYRYLPMYRG